MPTAEHLPTSLKGLARLEAQGTNDSTFRIDLDRLVAVLEKCYGETPWTFQCPAQDRLLPENTSL